MLKFALSYLKLGWSLIPLKPGSKEPLISSWKEFQKVPPSTSQVSDWFRQWPNANVGIVTGTVSNLAVIDADGTCGKNSLKELNLTSPTVSVTGSQGRHLFYAYPSDESLRNSVKKLPGLDVRGEGGYVVAPPSLTTRRYSWLRAPSVGIRLTDFPVHLFANIAPVRLGADAAERSEDWFPQALEDLKNGHVHNNLIRILGRLRSDHFSELSAITMLKPIAMVDGRPYADLEEKVHEIWARYEPGSASLQRNNQGSVRQENIEPYNVLTIHTPTNPDSIKLYGDANSAVGGQYESGDTTGYSNLDAVLSGGLKSSRLFTVAARTGTGKSNFLIGVSRHFCEQGKRVLFFSTETPFNEIWDRYKATLLHSESFKEHAFHVCDSFAPDLKAIEKAIEQVKPDLFIFDHANHISEETKEIAGFFQGLNLIRRKHDCCGIVSAQLNRAADWVEKGERVEPRMSMIKGSGTIEQGSSRVLLLSENKVTPEGTEITGYLVKNDRGPKGILHFMLKNNPYKMVGL